MPSPATPASHRIMLGVPSGGSLHTDMALSLLACSQRHSIFVRKSTSSWDNFSILWAMALNAAEAGEITHFAMLHADIIPKAGWIDVLVDEMQAAGVSLVSAAVPLKDHTGVLSSGVGSSSVPWGSWRRLTLWELFNAGLPATFALGDVLALPGRWPADPYLLHNNGCWLADLRDPRWHDTAADGNAATFFQFRKSMFRAGENADGLWMVAGESEDWFFSRRMSEAGIPGAITRKVSLIHDGGSVRWNNSKAWGSQEHDETTRRNWDLEWKDEVCSDSSLQPLN